MENKNIFPKPDQCRTRPAIEPLNLKDSNVVPPSPDDQPLVPVEIREEIRIRPEDFVKFKKEFEEFIKRWG